MANFRVRDNRSAAERVDRPSGVVVKYSWWYENCPKHGKTEHLGVLGGMCIQCKKEKERGN